MSLSLPPDAVPLVRHAKAAPAGQKLPPHYESCFGCGNEHPTGLHIQVVPGEDVNVTATVEVTKDHQGAPGLIHGGVLAASLDEVLGFIIWVIGQVAVTARLEVDYTLPVPVGTTLHLAAKADGIAGRKIYLSAEARLNAPDGPLAAEAKGLFIAVTGEHFEKHGSNGADSWLWRYNP